MHRPFHKHDCETCTYIDSKTFLDFDYDLYIHIKPNWGMTDVIMRSGIDGDYYCWSLASIMEDRPFKEKVRTWARTRIAQFLMQHYQSIVPQTLILDK